MGTPRLQPSRKGLLPLEHALAIAVLGLAVGGCAAPVEGLEPQDHLGRAIQPIVGGAASGGDQDAVVVLARFEGGARVGLCTATLLAPNLVVTARHCVSATDATAACGSDGNPVVGAALHGDRAPETLAVFTSAAGLAPDTSTDGAAKARGKKLVVDGATSICNHDLAFVVLDKAVAGPIAPIRLGPPSPSETLTAVGFGITEAGALPASRMKRSGLVLTGAGPMAYPDDARYGVGDAEFLLGESACAGDSGSPTLAGSGAVVGVASRAGNGKARDPSNAASTCLGATAHAVYAQLGANGALVMSAFAQAGAKAWLEGQPDPRAAKVPSPGSPSGAHGASTGAGAAAGPAAADSPMAASAEATETPAQAGGCSASGKPRSDSGAQGLALLFGMLLVLGLRRTFARRPSSRFVHRTIRGIPAMLESASWIEGPEPARSLWRSPSQ